MRKAIVVLLVLAACGGAKSGWSEQQRTDFIAGCQSSGPTKELCTCVQKKLEARHPELDDPADLDQDEVKQFTQECI